MKRYLFLNKENIVVHLVEGDHSQETMDQFLNDFGIMFNAVSYKEVDVLSNVWLDWTFNGESFVNETSPEK